MPIYFYTTTDTHGYLSNFSRHGFEQNGRYWPTVEHYFQAQKFTDPAHQEHVARARTSKEAAERGRSRSVPLRPDWETVKDAIMRLAVQRKFESHADIRALLLATGDEPLIENAPGDFYWGSGADGSGRNMLGRILMEVRSALRSQRVETKLGGRQMQASLIGAIAGDVIGSVHEATATKTKRFPLFTTESCFTDDTVMSAAVAEVLLTGRDYGQTFQRYYRNYPDAGYGQQFQEWCEGRGTEPYNSWGNGSAMRVSPVGVAFERLEDVIAEAERSASATHNHPEGIRGAQATAAAIFLARQRPNKQEIADYITAEFGYRLDLPLQSVRRTFLFDVSCQGTVPWALRSFIEGNDYEDTIRNAISLGGDADTLACIAGAIAGAYYGVPSEIEAETLKRLDDRLRKVVVLFGNRFCIGS